MINFDAIHDIANRRKVVLRGKVVTIIDLSGRKARIAEDGLWYDHKEFFPLTEEHISVDTVNTINRHISGKKIATVKPQNEGIQLIFEDNTRLFVVYSKQEGISFILKDSDDNKVV